MILKLIRTAKLISSDANEIKFRIQFLFRYLFNRPHESHFSILKYIDKSFFLDKQLIDVGANRGQTIQSFRLYTDTPVISFEPQKKLVDYIEGRGFKNSTVVACGLGNSSEDVQIFIPIYRGIVFDGLASTSEREARSFFRKDRFFFYDETKLEVVRQIVPIKNLDIFNFDPAVLKIDVQGAELDVLLGAKETILRSRPIIFLERPSLDREIKYLEELGYTGYLLLGNSLVRGNHGYNVIFMNQDHLLSMSSKIKFDIEL